MFGSGTTTLIIWNEEMNDMRIVKSLEESGLWIKGLVKQLNRNLLLGFGRYCGKVLPEPLFSSFFGRLLSQIIFFQYFFHVDL